MNVAVIGGGIAGLGAAWSLSDRHRVVVYEAEARLGGHACTEDVDDEGRSIAVDMGFIVFNRPNYPNLDRLFQVLGIRTEPSDMSFSVSVGGGRFEYQARAMGLLAQPTNLVDIGYRRMVLDILRFARQAPHAAVPDTQTTREFLIRGGYSESFRRDFLLPMVACIWSSDLESMLEHPAQSLISFLDNHGLLDVLGRPAWRTVTGGSRAYVARVSAPFEHLARLRTRVASIERFPDRVVVTDARGCSEDFDHVILATHADTALAILGGGASASERDVLSAFRYRENRVVLHRDPSFMPRRRRVWSSWNYVADGDPHGGAAPSVSYWMNRLQNLRTRRPVIVTLDPWRAPQDVVNETTFHHPQFDVRAVAARSLIPSLQGVSRTWFSGSYHGNGFHEDALRSGLDVAASLGSPPPWWSRGEEPELPEATIIAGA